MYESIMSSDIAFVNQKIDPYRSHCERRKERGCNALGEHYTGGFHVSDE